MGVITNSHKYSTTSGVSNVTGITDDIDYPHSGLIKALSQGIRGNYAIKGSATDFDITLAASTFTTIAVTTGKAYRDGKLVTISLLNATNLTGVHATEDVYQLLVAQADNTMALRGSNSVTNRLPDLTDGDIPIAVIKLVAGSAQGSAGTSDRLVQFLTTSKVSNDLSIGYDNSGYTEMSKISAASGGTTVEVGTAGGDFIIDNTDADKKIVARLGSDTSATAFEVRNNSDAAKLTVGGDGLVATAGNIKVGGNVIQASDGGSTITMDTSDNVSIGGDLTIVGGGSGADINLHNGGNATIEVNTTAAGTAGRDLTISAGTALAASSNNTDGGDLILNAGGGDGTGTSIMKFSTKVSGTDAVAERMRIHTNGNVGIGTNAPESNLHIAATASGAPILTLDNTASLASAGGEPQLIFKRSGATAASGDIGGIVFKGMNDAGTPALFEFGRIFMDMVDETAGHEDGRLIINIAKASQAASSSSATEMLRMSGPYGFQFNYNKEDHNFEVRGANNNNVLTVDASTDRVGIGVAEPSSALEIQDGLTTTGAVLTLSTKETSVVANDVLGRINFQAPLDTGLDSDLVSASIHAEAQATFSDTVNQTSIVFSTGASETATEKARITSGGKLGIGESVPDAPLHVKYSGTGDGIILESTEAGSSGAPDLTLLRSSSSPADNDTIGNIKFNGIDDDDDEETFVSIVGQMADITDATIDGRLLIYIKEDGSSGNHVLEISEGTLGLEERAAVGELQSNGSYGRIWIKNDNPNNLYFTNGDDNNIQLTNGATGPLLTGKHSIWVPAAAMYANTTNGCSALTQVELSNGPELKVLDFAADADDFAQFTIAFPKSWNEGTVTFQPYWTVTGTNTGTVVWGMSAVAFADNADQNTTFGSIALSAAKAHSGTSNDINVSAESAALTIKSAAVDTLTYFQIFNDTSASGQTGVARLTGVKILYTVNTGNDE